MDDTPAPTAKPFLAYLGDSVFATASGNGVIVFLNNGEMRADAPLRKSPIFMGRSEILALVKFAKSTGTLHEEDFTNG